MPDDRGARRHDCLDDEHRVRLELGFGSFGVELDIAHVHEAGDARRLAGHQQAVAGRQRVLGTYRHQLAGALNADDGEPHELADAAGAQGRAHHAGVFAHFKLEGDALEPADRRRTDLDDIGLGAGGDLLDLLTLPYKQHFVARTQRQASGAVVDHLAVAPNSRHQYAEALAHAQRLNCLAHHVGALGNTDDDTGKDARCLPQVRLARGAHLQPLHTNEVLDIAELALHQQLIVSANDEVGCRGKLLLTAAHHRHHVDPQCCAEARPAQRYAVER